MPTLDEFKEIVKSYLTRMLINLNAKEIDVYIDSEESIEVIQRKYDRSVRRFKIGEITEEVFRIGCAGAAACCLDMLY